MCNEIKFTNGGVLTFPFVFYTILILHLILICSMFLGRVGGLTLIFAALSEKGSNGSKYPEEKITVG